MKRIYLIDCPGVVPVSAKDSEASTVLKGVVRVENLATPAEHIPDLLSRVRAEYVERTYGLEHREGGWVGEEGAHLLLSLIAKKSGKLLRGGEADLEAAAKMVLNDWIRGKIPFFVPPPPAPVKDKAEIEVVSSEKEREREIMEEQERKLGVALGEKRVKGVDQDVGKIVTMSKFVGEDARRYRKGEEREMPRRTVWRWRKGKLGTKRREVMAMMMKMRMIWLGRIYSQERRVPASMRLRMAWRTSRR
jgi:nuclear GTP-binding protein